MLSRPNSCPARGINLTNVLIAVTGYNGTLNASAFPDDAPDSLFLPSGRIDPAARGSLDVSVAGTNATVRVQGNYSGECLYGRVLGPGDAVLLPAVPPPPPPPPSSGPTTYRAEQQLRVGVPDLSQFDPAAVSGRVAAAFAAAAGGPDGRAAANVSALNVTVVDYALGANLTLVSGEALSSAAVWSGRSDALRRAIAAAAGVPDAARVALGAPQQQPSARRATLAASATFVAPFTVSGFRSNRSAALAALGALQSTAFAAAVNTAVQQQANGTNLTGATSPVAAAVISVVAVVTASNGTSAVSATNSIAVAVQAAAAGAGLTVLSVTPVIVSAPPPARMYSASGARGARKGVSSSFFASAATLLGAAGVATLLMRDVPSV